MIAALCLSVSLLGADPTPNQLELLKTFRTEFVAITPGVGNFPKSFRMGDPQAGESAAPVRTVSMNSPFHIAKYEVPQNLWESVMGDNPSRWKGKRNSSEMFDWHESVEFCRRATELMRAAKLIGDKERIRLPTEAEWEYCARAGSTTAYSFGDDVSQLGQFAWFTGNAAGNDPPVGAKKPNAWGLHDMHGYLWEWCADKWHPNYMGAPSDGAEWQGEAQETRHVLRSGSWKDRAEMLKSSYRRPAPASLKDDAVGLRCVLSE